MPRPRCAAITVLTTAGTLCAQATFTPIPRSPAARPNYAHGVSGDGAAVVGYNTTSSTATDRPFLFRDGILTTLPASSGRAYAISRDGATIVGQAHSGFIDRANRWVNGVAELLQHPASPPEITGSQALAVSADGAIAAGVATINNLHYRAIRWVGTTGTLLPALPGYQEHGAKGVSADGTIITGYSYTQLSFGRGWIWQDGALSELIQPPGTYGTLIGAISADGTTVVGNVRLTPVDPVETAACMWRDGTFQILGAPAGHPSAAYGSAVSSDGSTVAGTAYSPSTGSFAFIWDAQNGLRNLNTLLVSQGANLQGWQLTEARAISGDGRVIAGHGTYAPGESGAWVATLVASCDPNCDASTTPPILNVNDFICFSQRFAASDPYANCDGSTQQPTLNVLDFVCFSQRFAAGCP